VAAAQDFLCEHYLVYFVLSQYNAAPFRMKRPQFEPGTEFSPFTEGARDPSGFLDGGFTTQQIDRVVEFVRLCFEEFLARTGITEKVAGEFPDRVPLYRTREGCPHYGNPATHQVMTDPLRSPDEPIALARSKGIGMTVHPSFFHEQQEQSRMKPALYYSFTCLATHRLFNPLNFSRETAFNHGISERLQFMPARSEIFGRDMHPVLMTSGLSVPDGFAADYRGESNLIMDYSARTALRDVTHTELWNLLEGMMDARNEAGHYPTSAQVDGLILEHLPGQASEILAHPSFAPAREGAHVIVFETRSQAKALLCPFRFSRRRDVPAQPGGLWDPQQFAFSDRLRDPVEVSLHPVSRKGKGLGNIPPVRIRQIMPFIPKDMLMLTPSSVRKQVDHIDCHVKGVGKFTVKK